MTTAGQVDVKLGLDSAEFIKNLNKAEKEFNDLQKNLKQSQSDFNKVSKAMAGMKNPTKEMSSLFNELRNKLQQDQKAVDDFNNKLNKLEGGMSKGTSGVDLLKGALGKLVAGGAIITLIKQFQQFAKETTDAFKVQDRAIKSLDNSLVNAGVYTAQYSTHLQELASEIQSYSNYGDEAVEKSVALGQSFAGNIKLTDELIKAVVDYAAATEQDLNSAFTLVGKSIGTNTNALARYGVSLDSNMSKEEKMTEITKVLGERFSGQAMIMADSSVQVQNALGDLKETIGQALNPAMEQHNEGVLMIIDSLNKWINKVRILRADLQSLSMDELRIRAQENTKKMGEYYDKFGENATATVKRLEAENVQIYNQMKALRTLNIKTGYDVLNRNKVTPKIIIPGTDNQTNKTSKGKASQKTQQDKALEEYKKYIDQYARLTSNYQATLEARQYLENTLHIDPVTQQQEYNKLLSIYQNYFSKMQEIATSGAKNKAEIQKLEEENLARQLQEIRVNKELETQRKLYDIQKGYQQQIADIDRDNPNINFMGGLTSGLFGDAYKRKLDLEKWYQDEKQKIINSANDNIEAQDKAFADLEILRNKKMAQDNLNTWQQYGSDVASILNGTFENIINGQQSFGEALKSLMMSLYKELIKMAWNAAAKEVEIERWKQTMLNILKFGRKILGLAIGAFTGGIGGVATGIGTSIVGGGGMMYNVDPVLDTYHSGGVVPGTKEQLAVLKGGERVLNPSENASYTNNEDGMSNGVNNIMMFNIKAWDGKDVINTLKANSQTINQIVNSGIKNNNQGLRTTVQNI